MTLRSKLLLVALTMLVLPWAGWQLLRQMDQLLREGQAQALLATAQALARALAASPEALPGRGPGLFVQQLPALPHADARFDDWAGVETRRFGDDALSLSIAVARADGRLWLRAEVHDPSVEAADAHWSTAAHSDHLWFAFDSALGELGFRLGNAQDGVLKAAAADGGAPALRLVGAWRRSDDGYAVEWQLPPGLEPERLGLQAVDGGSGRRVGTGSDDGERLWPLERRDGGHMRPIEPLLPADMRARLVDGDGWILGELGAIPDAGPADRLPWWRRELYQWFWFTDDPWTRVDRGAARSDNPAIWQALSGVEASQWQRDREAPRLLLAAAVPVLVDGEVRAALVLEREHQTLLLTERALGGLVGTTLAALAIAVLALLAFASRLGWRIRKLRDAAEGALGHDGRVREFPASASGDEIGDLSRSFARLLTEIAASQDYLRSLAGKLSHELNTPIAIVRGALDNIDPVLLAEPDRASIERARAGADRLAAIVRTMSEASRIEQAIASADTEEVDLTRLLAQLGDGYRDLLAPRRFELELPAQPLVLHCAPELLVQALDKLIDNARGFAPEDGWVRMSLAAIVDGARLTVANGGPLLPAALQHRLFDSMVSLRPERRGGVHLGFGLYVVRLVGELHRGSASAANLPAEDGVEFVLTVRGLPRR